MVALRELNAREPPPPPLRKLYNELRKLKASEAEVHPRVIDFLYPDQSERAMGLYRDGCLARETVDAAFDEFMNLEHTTGGNAKTEPDIPVYAHKDIPGLRIIPFLFPPTVQTELLSRLFHRDLSDARHKTNVHLHYHMSYPEFNNTNSALSDAVGDPSATLEIGGSFFQDDPTRLILPKDPSVHVPITVRSLLEKKLRWITLGGQYNWTDKKYPDDLPPLFPKDIANLLHTTFPDTEAEAAIINVYSPGDTLNVHRDVSEECDTGLISISFGCDGLFMVGHQDGNDCEIIRLRSGDAVYMTGTSRFAWHAVPKIIPSTCPSWLENWPVGPFTESETSSGKFDQWRGWMANKRINLNVRQMKEKMAS
ncbi:alkylated DNA repair protein AlkB [Polytolypa hystricis UAMH7299]|uniref:mRNA N(6)-methyladenine demethylase n=1 Tax=Polytolypa hystricis (strain UAMH7299) TaxID=1447883 RepID=A0A2B7YCK4_POLH7|nr:alkylated DNA repair protein AlkB [Polytolypa hystricis UAMH7299]